MVKKELQESIAIKEFPEGAYIFEVEANLKKVTHKIVVADTAISLSRKSLAEVYKGFENEN